jgi:ABC-type multidrug transport system fused ATPase/permease subunit
LVVLVVIALWRLVNSPLIGRVLAPIRQSARRARAHLGYAVWRLQIERVSRSPRARPSALAGSLFAMAQRSAFPDVMSVQQSGLIRHDGAGRRWTGQLLGDPSSASWFFIVARDVIGLSHLRVDDLLWLAVHVDRAVPAGGNCRNGQIAGCAMALIEAAGVHGALRDRVVLEDIDLAVLEGELHGIMGPNGAGKTTFFNVLTGRVKPTRGTIRLDGCGYRAAFRPIASRRAESPGRSRP